MKEDDLLDLPKSYQERIMHILNLPYQMEFASVEGLFNEV
jgi:hypothetical protein